MKRQFNFLECNVWDMSQAHLHKAKLLVNHIGNMYLVPNGRVPGGKGLKFNLARKGCNPCQKDKNQQYHAQTEIWMSMWVVPSIPACSLSQHALPLVKHLFSDSSTLATE